MSSTETLEIFKALSDETRLKIIELLLDGEKCVCRIYPEVDRTQPTVSNQLKLLESAGIISARRYGKNIFYSIKDTRIKKILNILEGGTNEDNNNRLRLPDMRAPARDGKRDCKRE